MGYKRYYCNDYIPVFTPEYLREIGIIGNPIRARAKAHEQTELPEHVKRRNRYNLSRVPLDCSPTVSDLENVAINPPEGLNTSTVQDTTKNGRICHV